MIKKWSNFDKVVEGKDDRVFSNTKILYNSEDIYISCREILSSHIDDAFVEVHKKYNTVSGDSHFTSTDLLSRSAIDMMVEQISVNMNLNSVLNSIKSENIDIETLKEIKDERNSVNTGDKIIAVLNKPTIIIAEGIVNSRGCLEILHLRGTGYNKIDLELDYENRNLLLVVKKETYEDFRI